jgi:phosphoglycerate dehydrogenase-like enzyme
VLTNAAGVMAVPIAEHVVGGVLHFLRGFDVAGRSSGRGCGTGAVGAPRPGGADAMPREVAECRAVVVGVRGIGAAVAERLSALGAECVGVRRSAGGEAPPGFARVVGAGGLDEALAGADVLVLAAPSTPETDRMLDARRLALLPAGAVVVNVGRGALADEAALAEALAGGRLRGAVLDVAEREPLPPESPLWTLPNVLLTPHVSPTVAGAVLGTHARPVRRQLGPVPARRAAPEPGGRRARGTEARGRRGTGASPARSAPAPGPRPASRTLSRPPDRCSTESSAPPPSAARPTCT